MITIGDFQIDIMGIITVISSLGACLFAGLTLYNQTKTKISIFAEPIVPDNGVYFKFDSLAKGKLVISNTGYKTNTVVDISVGTRKKMISVFQIFDLDNEPITVGPGEIKYYTYPVDGFVQYITDAHFNPQDIIWWSVRTHDNKIFKCKTDIKVSRVVSEKGE